MFRRLRERIAEEATKFPVGQLANNPGRLFPDPEIKSGDANSTEDLITLSDSSSVVVPHTSPQQFSIGEEEDGSLSEQSTPQKKQNASSGETNAHYSSNSSGYDYSFGQEYRPSKKLSYVPQSDIESEREDPPTLNLDSISKDQLMAAIQSLKAKSYKYKNKYAEVVKNFKELREEKIKIETTLIENQDKGLRRIAELREQCQLEQKAKAHLEENLRLLLEEKDSRICVLETQINLLKEGGKSNSTKTLPEDCDNQLSDWGSGDTRSEDSATSMSNDVSILQEKVERLQHQINQDKKTITAQKDQISLLRKQNENISQELEEKVKRLNVVEDEQTKLKLEHETVLKDMQDRLKELEKQQEESVMSMAETKRNMHEELELKEKQLIKAEEESKQYQAAVEQEKEIHSETKKQYEEKVRQLKHELELIEKTLEDEKQSLLQELGQGKTAAINLMQQECAKKIAAVEEEWKAKYEALQLSSEKTSEAQIEDLINSLKKSEEKLKLNEQRVEELDSLVSALEKENASLKNSCEKLESEIAQSRANYEKLKVSYSDYESLKEKENLLKMQEAINKDLNNKISEYLNLENDLRSSYENLTFQLDKKTNFITSLESEKNNLIEEIKGYESSQKELKISYDNVKNEVISLKEKLNDQVSIIEQITTDNSNKSSEIEELQDKLQKVHVNEKLAIEKLNMSVAETREFESENAELLLNNRLLKDEIGNLKCMLHNKEKILISVNEAFSRAEKEIFELNETININETILKQAVIGYKQAESFVTSLEKQQAYVSLALAKFQEMSEMIFKKSNNIHERLQLININTHGKNIAVSTKLENNIKINSETDAKIRDVGDCIENIKCTDVSNEKDEYLKPLQPASHETSQKNLATCIKVVSQDIESRTSSELLDVQSLLQAIDGLKAENASLQEELCACKTSSELQDIEFAKNITILHQSLSDLQEERNNLSLVLQNIENTHSNDTNNRDQKQNNKKKELDELNYQRNWEMRIAELNSKVKSEIEALSSQTEVVNNELKCLREQFKSNKESYSESIMYLNSKLLFRTETLINLKEDLDSSIENANCLKELLEEAKQELCEKNKDLLSLENAKKELENKCKNLKQEYLKKEWELKEAHKSQLIDLKEQTKLTIEKLNEQIKISNQQLKAKDEEFNLKISNTEKEYQMQISDLKSELENLLNCQKEINKFSNLSNFLEMKVFDSVSKLDTYCTKILSLSSRVNNCVSKLKEKDGKIFQLNNTISNLQEEIKNSTELRKDFNNLQNEFSLSTQLLQDASKELESVKNKLKSCEIENSHLKTSFENATRQIDLLSATNSDKDMLQISLDSATQEKESLKTKLSETLSDICNLENQVKELQGKYTTALNDIDNLNEQKINLEQQNLAASESSSLYITSVTSLIDSMFAKLKEKTDILLSEKEIQLKNIESKLFAISAECKSKTQEIFHLKANLSSCYKDLEDNKVMLKEEREKSENSEIAALEWKTKHEKSVKEIDMLSLSIKDINLLLEKKETQLNDMKAQLSSAEEEIKKFKSEMKEVPDIQDKLSKSLEDLQNYQKLLNEHIEKITIIEKEKHEWEQKCSEYLEKLTVVENEKNEIELKCNEQIEKLTSVENKKSELELKYDAEIEKLIVVKNEKQEWELKYNELIENLTAIKNEKCEWEQKYNEQIENITSVESEKHEWKLKFNEQSEKLATIENEKCKWEQKYNEQAEKLTVVENEMNNWEIKYKEQVEKLTAIENEMHDWELKYNEQVKKLTAIENEKCEWEQKYNEKIIAIENEKHGWDQKYNIQTEKLIAIENENYEWEQKCKEHIEKLATIENEKYEWEQKYNKLVEKLTIVENEVHQWELKYNEEVEKLTSIENAKYDWEQNYNRKLTAIENEKQDLEQKYNEQIGKLTAIENEKCQWEQKYNELIEKLTVIENKKDEWELRHNEQVEKLTTMKNEKDILEQKYNIQSEKLTAAESEKHDWELKYNQIFKDFQSNSNSAIENKEKMQQLMTEIQVKNNKIKTMVSLEELNKLKESLKLEIQKQEKLSGDLKMEIKLLLNSLTEKEIAIKAKETEKGNLEARHEESLKCMKDKLQNAEKNYKTQIEEMKLKINQLEKENSILQSEKDNLLIIQNQFKELKSGEEKVQSELKSKEEEVKLLREKLDTSNKEQVEKIHTFQESMKDKENMILKLKTNLEAISKEHKESVEELHKKIKRLEVEREQLMLQAQERVSATEAKCREDIKLLQEKCDKLLLENSEIGKSLLAAESNQASANQEISHLKDKLANVEKKLVDVEKTKLISESELSSKLEKLQQENKLLLHNSDHVEKLKAEKEELNEKLKTAVQQVNKINVLQTERDSLKKENEELSKEIKHIRTVQNESSSAKEKFKLLEENETVMNKKISRLNSENETLKSEIVSLKNSFKSEKDSLLIEKEKLLNQVQQLESCVKDPQNTSVQDYLETLKKEYEMAIKAKDDDMLAKLKQLVRDFSIQMDVKDKDSEQMITELMEKNQYLEGRLQREHADLRQDLFEKENALEEMRDSYEEIIQEKDSKIKEQELIIKNLSPKEGGTESIHSTVEQSDWDDTWVVPDEVAENSSPNRNTKTCDEHVQQIESLQEELSKCNSEIKELKVLLRLSPPETMVNNNNRRDSLHSLPEPTEFEYLKNIIYEYMMGKEPVTLAKVIAAVLRFNDVQTQQVIRREESRHPTK